MPQQLLPETFLNNTTHRIGGPAILARGRCADATGKGDVAVWVGILGGSLWFVFTNKFIDYQCKQS